MVYMQMEIPVPPVQELSVRGARNTFSGNAPGSADVEVALDMQVWPYVHCAQMVATRPAPKRQIHLYVCVLGV